MTHHKKPEILKRLARIEGHVRGIQRMVNEDLLEHYVSQTRDERGRKVTIELKDTVSNIF
jgi:hypothetical protein